MRKNNVGLALLLLLAVTLVTAACSAREEGLIAGADADPANLPDIVGGYAINGEDPRGTEYGGRMRIEPGETDGSYVVSWVVTGGLAEGVGTIEGNQLVVTWQSADERNTPSQGTARYTITESGELYGERYVDGLDEPGIENAFPDDDN